MEKSIKDLKLTFTLQDVTKLYSVNVSPYFNSEKQIQEILISFQRIRNNQIPPIKNTNEIKNIEEIFSQAPAIICILRGPDHIFDFANESYLNLVGHRNLIGKNIKDALPELEGQGFYEMLDEVYKSGKPFIGNELVVKIDDGEGVKPSYVDFIYQPIFNHLEDVTGIFVHAVDVTAKVKARKKLEVSENELRNLIDTIPALLWITGPEGENTYLNKKWYSYTGQSLEESSKFGWLNSVHDDDREKVRNEFKNAIKKREDYQSSFRLRNKAGDYRWVIDSGSPKYDSEGNFEGMVGIVLDAHEEKMKEQLIREKEHRIRSFIEQADVATALYTGKEMKVSMANDAMIRLWGKDASAIGKTLHEVLPELEGQPFHDLLQEVYETGKTYWGKEDAVDLMINDKLQTGYFNFTYKAMKDETGKIYGILNMATDVTEMVKSKQKLKESESRFRLMADLMPEKVATMDGRGNMIYFNQGWLDYTGTNSEDFKQIGWMEYIHPDDKQDFERNWDYSMKTGYDFEMEFRFKNKKGHHKWHLSRAEAILDEKGKIYMWICTATEIQKLKAEEKRKEDFLKMVSHELKTPVTSIKGYVQLLLQLLNNDKPLDSIPFQSSLERVDHQIVRLTRLIAEILDLSRIEKNKLELQKQTFSINELTKETIQDIIHTNTQHNIVMRENFDCDVHADKDRIGQVLINLITNSIKYSPNSQDIEVGIKKKGENKVAVYVKDYGIGIAKEFQKSIFKRFYRIDSRHEETYSGFGIGLYLANEIIERHNGYMTVESELGKGSKFTFVLNCEGNRRG